ncbi:MAG: type II and III secretion system protein family protein [Acidisphaera sp.]|nr:type II and III secretion system protein family protein [Acidisphaera sp.]
MKSSLGTALPGLVLAAFAQLLPAPAAFAQGSPAPAPAAAPALPPVSLSPPVMAPAAAVPAQSAGPPPVPAARNSVTAPSHGLTVEAGSGQVVTLAGVAASVFAADPKVAEVRPASPTSLFVFGVAPGRTTVAAMDNAGKVIAQYEVTVRTSGYGAAEASSAITKLLPGRNVQIQQTPSGLVMTGTVSSPEEADRAVNAARGYLQPKQTIDNRLNVSAPVQVTLHVRIAEMSREVSRNIGINWQAVGAVVGHSSGIVNPITAAPAIAAGQFAVSYLNGGVDVGAVIDALAQDNLVRVLAEPDLTAISGETASFLAGGEFPIPVSEQNNTVSVVFKQYGISLAFVPTVLGDGRISLRVRPEVSQLSSQGEVQLQAGNASLQIPALTVRRADTTVELGSGQTFAIAGLLSDNVSHNASAIPWLGDIPVLGSLFRSDSFTRNETELVIVVTPYIVKPVSQPDTVRLPTDGYVAPNDLERVFLLRQTGFASGDRRPAAPMHIPGSAGFIVQ